ncbi:MAG TPA: fumarylacetoacetate hydrolase family protein [Solirubrobacterales bacterium]|nr:fumarylacetoacetate hydrolase family protein [Solirubrobacterales bacterium]
MPRLASLRSGSRDGWLIAVDADRSRFLPVAGMTMQSALERWDTTVELLDGLDAELRAGIGAAFDPSRVLAALPRSYQWCEGSTYLSHMERCRAARGAALPPGHGTDPGVLQGSGDRFLAPTEAIPRGEADWGLDLESTVAVIVADVPAGVSVTAAGGYVRLVVIVNDLTFRNLLPAEFAKGLGFFQAKPLRALSPLAVTPDALGPAWDGRLLRATMKTWRNGELLGALDTSADVAFDFPQLISHAARTRPLAAGTVIGSGTVSNRDAARGVACLAEKRALQIQSGESPSPYLDHGDVIRIEAFGADGESLFGAIESTVEAL